jgi:hypothetical protein
MTREEIEACWKAPRNRKWGVYYCKADPRAIVPKGIKWMGWTINAARPSAIPMVLLLLAIMAGPIFLAAFWGTGMGVLLLTAAVSITFMCLLCAYLSSTLRFDL